MTRPDRVAATARRELLIGRTVSTKGGIEFRWRIESDIPGATERAALLSGMASEHKAVFEEEADEVAMSALPAWSDEKLFKHPSWRDGANAGRYGLHVID